MPRPPREIDAVRDAAATSDPEPEPEPLKVIKAEDIDMKAEPDWLIKGLVPAGSCALLVGEPKCGKSWLAIDLSMAIASGDGFLDRDVLGQGPVLYLAAEDSIPSWGARLDGIALARCSERKGLAIYLVEDRAIRLDDGADLGRLRRTIESYKARFVVLDPLAMLHAGDENKSGEMLNVLRGIRYLSQQSGATILVVHHLRKPNGMGGRRAHRIRGSSALRARERVGGTDHERSRTRGRRDPPPRPRGRGGHREAG